MSASNAFEADVLALLLQNAAIALLGDASGVQGSAAAGSVYVALHTADPGEAGDQTTNETSYTDYARVGVARSSAGWTVSGSAPTQAANAAAVTFPTCTLTGATLTHFSIGFALNGAGTIIVSAALTAPLIISAGITPNFAVAALKATCD